MENASNKYSVFFVLFWTASVISWFVLGVLFFIASLTGGIDILMSVLSAIFVLLGGYYSASAWLDDEQKLFWPRRFLMVLASYAVLIIFYQNNITDVADIIKAYSLTGWLALFGFLAIKFREKQLLLKTALENFSKD